jgi:ribosomal protein L14E/L6E/L27E
MNTEILVQIGRIVYINYGSESQKVAIVRDFINTKKIIIDSPNGSV